METFSATGSLWGEPTGHQWTPLTKAGDAGLWCILWSASEHTVEHTIETPVILDAIAFIMTSIWCENRFNNGTIHHIHFLIDNYPVHRVIQLANTERHIAINTKIFKR